MVYRVVSTKLTEDEHLALIEECNRQGVTPSSLIKGVILDRLKQLEITSDQSNGKTKSLHEGRGDEQTVETSNRGMSELMKLVRLYRIQKEKTTKEGGD